MRESRGVNSAHRRSWGIYWLDCGMMCIALAVVSGCGDREASVSREAVSGTVMREGILVDSGTILFKPTSGGTAASTSITDGSYRFDKKNGPVAGTQKVEIVQFALRGDVPPGTPKKDAPVLPETRFKKKMPAAGWVLDAEVTAGHDEPLDFQIDK
jgi:hypothetical protein